MIENGHIYVQVEGNINLRFSSGDNKSCSPNFEIFTN